MWGGGWRKSTERAGGETHRKKLAPPDCESAAGPDRTERPVQKKGGKREIERERERGGGAN